MLTQKEFLQWKKKRTSTYVVFLFMHFLIGLELGCVNATLWIYVSTLLKTANDEWYYGLINAAFFIPSLFCPLILARIVDKTRRIRIFLIAMLCLSIIGSILYSIPVSPLYPLIGRFLSGFTMAVGPLIISEVARSYTSKELIQRIPLLNGSRMFGYAFGPCISLFFTKVDFWIGQIHITYANIIGPILIIFGVVFLFAVVFFTHDLSREYDMKSSTMEKTEQDNYKVSTSESTLDVIKRMLQNFDTLLLIIISLFFGVVDQLIFRVFPLLIIEKLKFSYTGLNLSLVALSLFNTALIIGLVYWKMADHQIYYTGVVSVISIMITTSLLLLIYHKVGNVTTLYFLIALTIIGSVIFLLSDQTFGVIVCAKLAFSCNQGFMEGARLFSLQSGRIIGGVFIGTYYDFMNAFYLGINIVSILFLCAVISRRKTLASPEPII